MSNLVQNLLIGGGIFTAAGLWVAFIYITAVPDHAGPGTRVWHPRDIWRWLVWKMPRR
ncbi:MAG: hypothetical protein HOV92_17835 [Streptomyces sp.]|nr:hypothetical protein [Streptomyces sp.]